MSQKSFVSALEASDTLESAQAYLSNRPGSIVDFFKLDWKVDEEGQVKYIGDTPFSILHSPTDHWWEVGSRTNEGAFTVERFGSMEQAIAYIVSKWW